MRKKEGHMNIEKISLNCQKESDDCSYSFFNQKEIGNMMDYKLDKEVHLYDKLCMVKIENADLLLTSIGEEKYSIYLKIAITEIYAYLDEMKIRGILKAYVMDGSTFIIVGKPEIEKEIFLNIIGSLHKQFRYISPSNTDIPILARFVIITNQSNMLERAIKELHAKENAQKHFIIGENSENEEKSTSQELKMINILHWAIENDSVVPYYQGIYDTKSKQIDKYESLMRIVDKDGVVYSPDTFIKVAKKYHMYLKLSEMMISRVLEDMDSTNIAVSINLSAYDINSNEFRRKLFNLLEQRKSKALLVFEILEDEIFKETKILQQFILDIDKLGVKVAIDDFGSGYSNLLEIAQISPHYIKIDGEIIRRVNDSEKNRAVLESIVYLAKKIDALTVAEHVETLEIIKSLKPFDIDLLQGFYFSKPEPIQKLSISSRE